MSDHAALLLRKQLRGASLPGDGQPISLQQAFRCVAPSSSCYLARMDQAQNVYALPEGQSFG